MIDLRRDTKNGRVYLSPTELQRLLGWCSEEPALLGEFMARTSPRIGKATSVQRNQVFVPDHPGVEIAVVYLKNTKDTRAEGGGKYRYSWVPWPLYEKIENFCDRKQIASDEEIFRLQPGTYREKYQDAREELAEETGNEGWLEVQSQDFRRYFATNSYHRLGLDKVLICDMGGWAHPASIEPYLEMFHPVDIQNRLFAAQPYSFAEQEVPHRNIRKQFERFDEVELDEPYRELDEFAD